VAGLFLLAGVVRSADEPASSFKPAVLVRVKALDDLLVDARYLVKQAGREEEVKQFEKMIKARTGPKGLEGIDTKKPIGLYGSLSPQLDQSQGVLLLPIADEKTFLEFLDGLDLKPEKDATDLYTLTLPNIPVPVEFRFAHGYMYATAKYKVGLPAKDKLPLPATVLSGGEGMLSVTTNIDRIPMQLRKFAISASSLQLGNMKEEAPPGETPAHKELREAALDEMAVQVKSVLTDGGAVMLKLDVDREKHDLSLSFSFGSKPGSGLEKEFSALSKVKSVAPGLAGKDSAMGGFLHLAVPKNLLKALGALVDEGFEKGLGNLDPGARDLFSPLADAFKPTAKEGKLGLGVSVRGPAKNGKYTVVGSLRLTNGESIEKAIKRIVDKLPEEAKKPIKLDADTAAGVNIHRITPDHIPDHAKEVLGDGPVYFAVRKDALIVAGGEQALDAIKQALTVEPKAGGPLHLELSVSRIARLMARENPAAPEAAKKAFKEEGSDKVRLSVTAGNKIEVKLNVKSAVITFAALLDKAKKEAAEK
jgi:hypothetical protein